MELPRHAKAVLPVPDPGFFVPRRWRAIEEVDMVRPVFDAVAQQIDCAAFGDRCLQAGEEFAPRGGVLGFVGRQAEGFSALRLGFVQENGELRQVDAVFAVVVLGEAAEPAGAVAGGALDEGGGLVRVAGMAGERGADEAFEAAFGGVGGHALSDR